MSTPSSPKQKPLGANTESQGTSSSQNPKPADIDAEHWSLSSKIEASKYLEGGPEAHLTKGAPATLIRYASAERDLSIIPPVLCHMGFVLGGILVRSYY